MADRKKTPGMMGGQATLDLIKEVEGFSEDAYVDAGGHSIGYGHFIKKDELHLMNAVITKEQAEEMLKGDIADHQETIRKNLKVEVSDEKMAALTSLVYNVGKNSKAVTKVIALLNEGREAEVGGVLSQYVKSKNPKTGQLEVNSALQSRRAFEEKVLTGQAGGDLVQAYRGRNKVAKSPPGPSGQQTTKLEEIVNKERANLQQKEADIFDSQVSSAADNESILAQLKTLNQEITEKIRVNNSLYGQAKKVVRALNKIGAKS